MYFVVRVRCRKESSRSLSHLLMSFLFCSLTNEHQNQTRSAQDLIEFM